MDSGGLVQIPVDVSESIDAGYDDEGVRRNLPVCRGNLQRFRCM